MTQPKTVRLATEAYADAAAAAARPAIVAVTQAQYDALTSPDPATLYLITS